MKEVQLFITTVFLLIGIIIGILIAFKQPCPQNVYCKYEGGLILDFYKPTNP